MEWPYQMRYMVKGTIELGMVVKVISALVWILGGSPYAYVEFSDYGHTEPFYPAAIKGSGVLWYPERARGGQGRQAPLTLSCPYFFTDHCQTCQISDKFDHGGSASLNMRIMDHSMN